MQMKSDRLLALLTEEYEMLKKMMNLTEEQSRQLAGDKPEAMNESLDKRKAVMDKIDGLHQESDDLMQSYVSVTGKIAKNNEIEERISQITEIRTRLLHKNDENARRAKEVLEQYGAQGNKLSMGRKSIGLYAQGVTYSGDNYDNKS